MSGRVKRGLAACKHPNLDAEKLVVDAQDMTVRTQMKHVTEDGLAHLSCQTSDGARQVLAPQRLLEDTQPGSTIRDTKNGHVAVTEAW